MIIYSQFIISISIYPSISNVIHCISAHMYAPLHVLVYSLTSYMCTSFILRLSAEKATCFVFLVPIGETYTDEDRRSKYAVSFILIL